jgi:hypothetical protein
MTSLYKQEPKIANSMPKRTPIAKDNIKISFGLKTFPRVEGIIITIPIKTIIEPKKGINVLKTEDNPHMRR